MIRIEKFAFNPFQENTFIITDSATGEAFIVDAGCYEDHEFTAIENYIKNAGLHYSGLLNTHCHIDHILGIPYFKEKYNLEFRAHENESMLVTNGKMSGEIFGLKTGEFPPIDAYVQHGDLIQLGESVLKALFVPGHSPGSIAYYSRESNFVITGDVLFQGSIGRTDLPGGDYDTLISSIKSQLLVLPPDTVVYPGHGPATTIGEEIRSNPFLQMH